MDLKLFNKCLHSAVSALNVVAILYALVALFMVGNKFDEIHFFAHGWNCKELFLSLWVMVLQYVYFGLHSAIDVLDLFTYKYKSVIKVQDYMNTVASYLLFTIVFPFSLMVFLLFWTVYHWNRDVIYPEIIEEIVPSWINHVLHTLPVPLSVIYMLTSNKKEPSKVSAFSGLISFLAVYTYVFVNYYSREGKFIYIALDVMSPIQKFVALSFAALSPAGFLFLGYKINEGLSYVKQNSIHSLPLLSNFSQ